MTGYTRAAAAQAIDLLRTLDAGSQQWLNGDIAWLFDLPPEHYERVHAFAPDAYGVVWRADRPFIYPDGKAIWRAPNLTGSLDAAHAVAPEGWFLRVEPRFHSDEGQVTFISHALKPDWSSWHPNHDAAWIAMCGPIRCAKPAPAILAAAIAALAHDHGDIIVQGDER